MGIFSRITAAQQLASNVVPLRKGTSGIRSPWTEGKLEQFVYADIFNTDVLPVTRKEAMSVPAYAKARHTIVGLLAGRPLRDLTATGLAPTQPAWLSRTDKAVPLWHRMASTLDDMLWYGHSLWGRENGTDGFPLDAWRIPIDEWQINDEGSIETWDGEAWQLTKTTDVIYMPGSFEGLLNIAGLNIRAAKHLEKSWASRAANPIPMTELHLTDDDLTQDEVNEYRAHWSKNRTDPNGAVGVTPRSIELKDHGDTKVELFTEGRNFARLDAAAYTNLPGVALDASLSEASLTYTTTEGKTVELKERAPFWSAPIEARLSMDDVCPRGHRIRFDFNDNPNEITPEQTGPYSED